MLSWIELDREAFRKNIDAFRQIVSPHTSLMVVIKANAYGHGLTELAPAAAEAADWLGVNSIAEAESLTGLGIRKRIAILGHTETECAETIIRNQYRQCVYRRDVAQALSRAAERSGEIARVHLKIETGTNRQGVSIDELGPFVDFIRDLPHVDIEGVYTHFANIEDTLDASFAQLQLRRFKQAVAILEEHGVRPPVIHSAATAGALLYPETGFTLIRLGIGSYGIWPSRETRLAARERGRLVNLTPVLTWKTRIVQIKNVAAGDSVGYGLTYQANRSMRAAVLPVGYYDGYDRKLSNSGRVLVRGQFAPVIGRVAMNMTMIDVTDVMADNDDEVVLLGTQAGYEIHAEELAEKCGTIAYEIVSRINPLLPRISMG